MKTQNIKLQLLLLLVIFFFQPLQAIDLNQPSGTISVLDESYTEYMNGEVWNINIGSDLPVKLSCTVDIFDMDDIIIYSVDKTGNESFVTLITAYDNRTVSTIIPSGKARIVFSGNNEGGGGYINGFTGFSINYSADNSFSISENSYVTGNSYVHGSSTVDGISMFNGNAFFSGRGIFNGYVGIGTSTPSEKLEIRGAIRGSSTGGALKVRTNYGYVELGPQEATSSNFKTDLSKFLFNKPVYFQTGALSSYSTTDLSLQTNGTTRMTVANSSGNVGINTTNPQYQLDVKGTIRATEVLVQSVDSFPDFVFKENYLLPKLTEVNNYIQTNGHLPNIPSAAEVKGKGINLVDMQVKLLQKIEELTLYTIDQNKKIEKQNEVIQTLQEKIEKIASDSENVKSLQ
ncbi:MAG: hypothetical protein VB110_09085 [Bacteroidales bacterium]|nr:hypothetical protein [Bacteroidales bacterium]